MAAQKAQHRIAGDIEMIFAVQHHLDASDHKEDREQKEDPVELGDQRRSGEDHDAAQHDYAENAVEQHPVLQFARDGEIAEDHRDDENVVHRQALFDDIAGEEQEGLFGAKVEKDENAEGDSERDVKHPQAQAVAHAHAVMGAAEHAEVEGRQSADKGEESEPEPVGRSERLGGQEIHVFAIPIPAEQRCPTLPLSQMIAAPLCLAPAIRFGAKLKACGQHQVGPLAPCPAVCRTLIRPSEEIAAGNCP